MNATKLPFCVCCGMPDKYGPYTYKPNHCDCKTCIDNPNYCADCGAFVGSDEKRDMHSFSECSQKGN